MSGPAGCIRAVMSSSLPVQSRQVLYCSLIVSSETRSQFHSLPTFTFILCLTSAVDYQSTRGTLIIGHVCLTMKPVTNASDLLEHTLSTVRCTQFRRSSDSDGVTPEIIIMHENRTSFSFFLFSLKHIQMIELPKITTLGIAVKNFWFMCPFYCSTSRKLISFSLVGVCPPLGSKIL